MATDEDPEAPGSRLTLLIGLVVAGLASTAAFGRVFRGTDVTVRLCLLSVVATALAALIVRRGVLLATVWVANESAPQDAQRQPAPWTSPPQVVH